MSIPSDPSSLTKAKLKEELIKLNVKLPSSKALKQEYLDLYIKHTRSEENEGTEPRTEEPHFSSDDELLHDASESAADNDANLEESTDDEVTFKQSNPASVPTPVRGKSIQKKITTFITTKNQISKMAAIEDMSNQELAEELRSLGVSPGPIIASTRRVYEKKLLKLRQTGGGEPPVEKIRARYYDEVPDDEERSPAPKLRQPKLRRRPIHTDPDPDESYSEQYSARESPEKPRPSTAGTRRGSPQKTKTTSHPTQPATQGGGGIPMIVKILALLLVLFLVYLVIMNMEPLSESNIPKELPADDEM